MNLNQMLEQTQTTLASIEKSGSKDSAEMEQKQKRLRNLEDSIKVQLNRLNRQIDYIKLNVECAKIKKVLDEQEDELGDEQIGKLKRKMSEASKQMEKLLTFMKDANKRVMKQQSDSTNTGLGNDIEMIYFLTVIITIRIFYIENKKKSFEKIRDKILIYLNI